MARFKNPFAGTTLAVVGKHLMTAKGWSEDRVQAWFEGLWDRLGPDKRFTLISRYHNVIVRAWIKAAPTKVWVDHRGFTVAHRASSTGKTVSSTIILSRPEVRAAHV